MKKVIVDKNTLKKYYLDENLSIPTTAEKMNLSYRTIQRAIKEFNFTKDSKAIKEQRQNEMQKKYGVNNAFQSKDLMKYAKEKSIKTLQEKYGVSHNFLIKSAVEKRKIAKKEHYFANPEIIKDRESLQKWITEFKKLHNAKPAYIDLKNELKCAYSTVCAIVSNFRLKSYFKTASSYLELSVEDFIQTLNIEYKKHDRTQIKPLELDFYFPKQKVAIEVNDIATHNSTRNTAGYCKDEYVKDKNYHTNKSKICEESGIRLIHIWEYEWNDDRQRPILENIIQNALGLNNKKIYARKLKIEIKESKAMREFFNTNNIQGFRPGKFAICLVDKNTNEVYMSYMMGSAFFGKGKYEWEVIRGATKLGYTVVGGASKIWKYFLNTYKPKNCVYYIDYNYFNGNSLPYLGLKYLTTQISFKNWWVKEQAIKNRQPSKNKEISEKYKTGEVLQVYNAGTKVYLWESDN